MDPANVPLGARRNVPFVGSFQLEADGAPIDLTDCGFRMQVRLYGKAPGASLIDLRPVTTDIPGIRIDDGPGGAFTIRIAAAALDALPAPTSVGTAAAPGRATFAYDLVLTDIDGVATTIMEGTLTVQPGVTRP